MSQVDGEIVGLRKPENGRSCGHHEACGVVAAVGTMVRFKFAVIDSISSSFYFIKYVT